MMLAVMLLIFRQQGITAFFAADSLAENTQNSANFATTVPVAPPNLGPRHKLNYQQWLDVLKQEAKVAADKRPKNLTILAGDSLSMWFPSELLPDGRTWLNQGVSGETSRGLLKRLNLFDRTQPEKILVMIGINDLIRGNKDEEILKNSQKIMQYLRKKHPKTQIILQSILPHSDESATWEGRDKLLAIPNNRIRKLNQQLQAIAKKEGVKFLNLYPLFTNEKGNLHPQFSTDGLHLNDKGYLVWRSALLMYSQIGS